LLTSAVEQTGGLAPAPMRDQLCDFVFSALRPDGACREGAR
jgi:hypothetical protein